MKALLAIILFLLLAMFACTADAQQQMLLSGKATIPISGSSSRYPRNDGSVPLVQTNGLVLWLDADYSFGSLTDGTWQTNWPDCSTNAADATSTNSAAGTNWLVSAWNVHSKKGIHMESTGSADADTIGYKLKALTDYPYDIFVAFKWNGANNNPILFNGVVGSTLAGAWFQSGSGVMDWFDGANNWFGGARAYSEVNGVCIAEWWLVRGTYARENISNIQADNTTSPNISGVLAGYDTGPVYVGISRVGNSWKPNWTVGEIIVYNQVLSSSQRTAVYNYLNTKWR